MGRVVWEGEVPRVPPLTGWVDLSYEAGGGCKVERENPHVPSVDPRTRGLRNAVVFLRGVDARRARPWDHLPVRIEQRDYRFHIQQGETDSLWGFVRQGDSIEMVSAQPVFHSLHACGATFFTLAFPAADSRVRARRLTAKGRVELTSAAGYFWMRAHLFVDNHPYYTRTDAEGRFALKQVPPGCYDVVCWVPSWREQQRERGAENAQVFRLRFQPPVELKQKVEVRDGATACLSFRVSEEWFRLIP
jgi:hypothetical protein